MLTIFVCRKNHNDDNDDDDEDDDGGGGGGGGGDGGGGDDDDDDDDDDDFQDFRNSGFYQDWNTGASLLVQRADRYLRAFDMVRIHYTLPSF